MGLLWRGSENGGPFSASAVIDLHPLLVGEGPFLAVLEIRQVTKNAAPGVTANARLEWRERNTGAHLTEETSFQPLDADIPTVRFVTFPIELPAYDPENVNPDPDLRDYFRLVMLRNGEEPDGTWDVDVRLI